MKVILIVVIVLGGGMGKRDMITEKFETIDQCRQVEKLLIAEFDNRLGSDIEYITCEELK